MRKRGFFSYSLELVQRHGTNICATLWGPRGKRYHSVQRHARGSSPVARQEARRIPKPSLFF